MAEYHEQEEIFKLRLGHLKKVRGAYAGHSILPEVVESCVLRFLLKKAELTEKKDPNLKLQTRKNKRGA